MTPEGREANILNALKAEHEAAKEQIVQDFKRRGMSSEDVLKHNDEVRRGYAEAGLPVTMYDLMQDFCAQALVKLADAYYQRIQEVMVGIWEKKLKTDKTS